MSDAKTLLRNLTSTWIGYVVNALVTLLLTPVVLDHLGSSGYGLWILASSIVGYYGLLDLGFRAGVGQFLTRSIALGDGPGASSCMTTALAVLLPLGCLMAGISLGLAWLVPAQISLGSYTESEVFYCILLVGCTSAFGIALSPFTAVFSAKQRFDLANLIGIISRLVSALLILLALKNNLGLVGVALATCLTTIGDYLVRWRVAGILAPEIHLARKHFDAARLREMGKFGGWSFLISINSFAYLHVPNILIAVLAPISAVGHYALSTGLVRQINSVLSPIAQVLYPAATSLYVQGSKAKLERLYHDGTRLSLLIATTASIVAGTWATDFYALWVGETYVSGVPYASVALIFKVLLVSTIAASFSGTGWQVLSGSGNVRVVALSFLASSCVSIALMFPLTARYGLVGTASSTVVAALLFDLIALPVLVQRFVGLGVRDLLKAAMPRPILVLAVQAPMAFGLHTWFHAENWFELAYQLGIVAAGVGSAAFFLGTSRLERETLLWSRVRSALAATR